jgi:AcrR family transcriptional regulator
LIEQDAFAIIILEQVLYFDTAVPLGLNYNDYRSERQCETGKMLPPPLYAVQKGGFCSFMKKNQTAFMKLCLADSLIKLMKTQDFDTINVNSICKKADIGRTTFYRYFDSRNSKEEMLLFKIKYEWEQYSNKHETDEHEKGDNLTAFIYENKHLFSMLYHNNLISVIMRALGDLIPSDKTYDKQSSYLMSFFIYGYFGIIYQWIKYEFDETPEQIQRHINDTISAGLQQSI